MDIKHRCRFRVNADLPQTPHRVAQKHCPGSVEIFHPYNFFRCLTGLQQRLPKNAGEQA
jgi:hypothetical protein